jgi:hypothetical protein
LSDFFVDHPIAAQRELAERVRAHWVHGSGARRIPDRSPALELLRVVPALEDAESALGRPELWTTSASAQSKSLSYADARVRLAAEGTPVLIVFGTGWGLAESVRERADFRLEPIRSPRPDGYNHLSVRAAAAISFDRLLSPPAAAPGD